MKLKYRPEIDGLRTIAVLSVLIYHAELFLDTNQLLAGGFMGVDVFFVISGFLITSIIISEHHQTGRFSIMNFYERRVRRILPALLTVMLVSLPFAWIYLYPSQLIDFSKSLLSSLAFSSNFYWDISLQEYGAESALLKPFLHTWSLSVEEQYYIIFPLLLIAIYRWCKGHTILLLSAGMLLSFLFANWMTARDPSFSFYMLPTRFWELLTGGLLANILYFHPLKNKHTLLNKIMPLLGIYLIAHAFVFIEFNSSHHPGTATLLPIIGTLLIIWFANEKDLVTRTLSSKLFVRIGLISYSLYLWHYPIFAFGRIINSSPTWHDKAVWTILTFILSIGTYFAIEKPFRNKITISRKALLSWISLALLPLLIFSFYSINTGGVKERFPEMLKIYDQNEFDINILRGRTWQILNLLSIEAGYDKSSMKATSPSKHEMEGNWFSIDSNKTKILIIGNSHSKDLFNAFYQNRELFADKEFARFALHPAIQDNQISELVNSPNFKSSDIILISFNNRLASIKKLPLLIKQIKEQGKEIILTDTVIFKAKEKLPIFDWYIEEHHETFSSTELNKIFFNNIRPRGTKIKQIAQNLDVIYLDKYDFICRHPKQECTGVTPSGYKAFYDQSHYTLEGASYFGKRIHEIGWLNTH